MKLLVFCSVVAFFSCLILTPLVRDLFIHLGLVDHPDGGRKAHPRPIPRVGGICVYVSYVATFGILFSSHSHVRAALDQQLLLVSKVLPGASLVFATGLLDDVVGLKPWQKLLGEMGGGALVCWAGIRVVSLVGHPTDNHWGVAITIVWLLACTNAFNLIDGVDGLASGVGFLATVTTLGAALLHNNLALALAAAPLAGCLLAFLRYNFNPASIFLGDSGSLVIGFLLGCYGMIWSQKCATVLGLTAPLMALSIPLLDTALAIVRRFVRQQPIFGADGDHIHHRLLRRGANPRNVAVMMYLLCGLAAAFSLLQSVAREGYSDVVIILFAISACIGIQRLGYIELGVVPKFLLGGGLRRVLHAEVCLRTLEESLVGAATADDCWKAILESSRSFGFTRVSLAIGGQIYDERFSRAPRENCWNLRVPLSVSDYIEFAREFQSFGQAPPAGPFVEAVRRGLQSRLQDFHFDGSRLSPVLSDVT